MEKLWGLGWFDNDGEIVDIGFFIKNFFFKGSRIIVLYINFNRVVEWYRKGLGL